ncbi:hypothetical protein HDK64DRAFT_310364 [Phyllosticta capitalensis]
MVLYISKPLWKSFRSNKDDSYDTAAPTYTNTIKNYPSQSQRQNKSQRVNRSPTNSSSKKRRGPKIRIHPPAHPASFAPGTCEELPYDDTLLAAPLESDRVISKVFVAANSPVSLRKLSPVEFFPTLDALSPVREKSKKGGQTNASGTRFTMSSRRSIKTLTTSIRQFARPTKIMLANGRTEPAKVALRRTLSLRSSKKQSYVPRLIAQHGVDELLPTPATRRRASGVWVRDEHGNSFWANGMLAREDEPEGPAETTPRIVLLGAEGTPDLAVSVAAFSARRKKRFGRVRLYIK